MTEEEYQRERAKAKAVCPWLFGSSDPPLSAEEYKRQFGNSKADIYKVSEEEWDRQPGGDQRR
jgi:hypothetical protein